ncbi:uncharacterized protein [Dermacentor andersoni]|uniref:uncharacterized protein n=1 Tax=Dermacentor andersoni TaxID=34620 RepID=UPI002416ED6F|nr:uncharacterized protein LOC129380535 [Dermacentor andersoni]
MSVPNANGSVPQDAEDASAAVGTAPSDSTVEPAGGVVRSSSAWMGINWPIQNWSTARRGHSDGHVMPRDASTSTSRENVVAPSRPATVKRKRVIDVGQKTVKQMNDLARYVNAKGPCAICRTPGAVVTLTQIKRRRRKFMRHWKNGGNGAAKGSPEMWPPDSAPLLAPSAKAQKSVSWVEHHEVQHDAGPDFLNNETGAFLLLLSVVALVVGILVIFKATENSLKEYLGLITPTTSVSSALPVCSEELALEAARPPIEDAPVEEDAQGASLLMQERAARQIQRWYRQGTSHLGPELEGARRKRVDRWAQSLRAFFSRKKINHFRAGLQKRWGKRRAGKAASEGAEDLAPLEPNEVRPAASAGSGTTLFSAYSSQNVNAHGPAAPSTSIAGSDGSRSGPCPAGGAVPEPDSQVSNTDTLRRSHNDHPAIGRSRSAQ